jgi:hypothetical protein
LSNIRFTDEFKQTISQLVRLVSTQSRDDFTTATNEQQPLTVSPSQISAICLRPIKHGVILSQRVFMTSTSTSALRTEADTAALGARLHGMVDEHASIANAVRNLFEWKLASRWADAKTLHCLSRAVLVVVNGIQLPEPFAWRKISSDSR